MKRCSTACVLRETLSNSEIALNTYGKDQHAEHQEHHVRARVWSRRNAHSLLTGMQHGTATWEDSYVASHNTEYTYHTV